MRRTRAAAWPAYAILALILVAGLYLRLRHNGYGLPYVYNQDEGRHFTNRAVAMFGGGSWDPGYYENPSGFTYLLNIAMRFRYGHGWPFGGFDNVVRMFASPDPSGVYELTRGVAALLCCAGAAGVFFVGRRLWGLREGLVAAAVLAFAFLPVAYSRIAVTDVGTLLPVAIALFAAVRIYERGDLRWYLVGGAAVGFAIGFKYTAGLVLLPLLIATAFRMRTDGLAPLKGLGIALVVATAAFFVTTPYFFINFSHARHQLTSQSQTVGDFGKVGQAQDNGFAYYLWSLTWGLGWVPLVAAAAGCFLVARRDPVRALLLAAFPLALFIYLSVQSRFFGRWLLPVYPALALFAGYAIVQAVGAVAALRGRRLAAAGALAAVVLAALAQPLAADVRTMRLLGRTDTRQLARDYLVKTYPPRLRIVIEPAVPGRYYRLARPGRKAPPERKQFVRGFIRDIGETRIDYVTLLRPEVLDHYRRSGYCLVMTMSVIRGRAENDRLAPALAYYARLERESKLVFEASPYDKGVKHLKFNFDHSYDYYPSKFARPGPDVKIYRLNNCKQGYGPLPKGAGVPQGVSE
ncbi:MAG TPA: glycosyltransferase family 39 protein [Thermoleophilaceae bacterium]